MAAKNRKEDPDGNHNGGGEEKEIPSVNLTDEGLPDGDSSAPIIIGVIITEVSPSGGGEGGDDQSKKNRNTTNEALSDYPIDELQEYLWNLLKYLWNLLKTKSPDTVQNELRAFINKLGLRHSEDVTHSLGTLSATFETHKPSEELVYGLINMFLDMNLSREMYPCFAEGSDKNEGQGGKNDENISKNEEGQSGKND